MSGWQVYALQVAYLWLVQVMNGTAVTSDWPEATTESEGDIKWRPYVSVNEA